MDHLQAIEVIMQWKKRNRISTWNEVRFLLRTYAMIVRKFNGDLNVDIKLLAYPSDTKSIKPYLFTTMDERKRTLNWYKLNDHGKQIVKELVTDLKLQPQEIETYIYTL